jgi:hypothetical protein
MSALDRIRDASRIFRKQDSFVRAAKSEAIGLRVPASFRILPHRHGEVLGHDDGIIQATTANLTVAIPERMF